MRNLLGAVVGMVVLAACGSSSSSSSPSSGWRNLSSVTVTVAQPGLPPPYGRPKTISFTSPAQVARVTALLNANKIAKAAATIPSSGCAGGYQIGLVVVRRGAAPVKLSAYRCANTTSGDVNGDLVGFLKAIGVLV